MSTVTTKQTTNERIRGPNLAILIKSAKGVPFEEGLARANAKNRIIASNKRLSQALVGSEEWRTITKAFVCWSGTMTGYVEPDRMFKESAEKISSLGNGHFIVYVDPETKKRYLFPVPEEHLDKKNAILVAEHPDYTLEIDGKNRIVRAAQVDLVERFPAKDGWYLSDAQHDIPSGDAVDAFGASDAARHLWRIEERVGPVARDYYDYNGDIRRGVGLGVRASDAFGVAVEAPAGGARLDGVQGQKKLQVEAADKGILITGVTLDELRTLIGNVNLELQDVLQTVRSEKLVATRQLLQALEIKG